MEIKRSSRPGPPVLSKWIQQARAHAKQEGKPWLVVVAGHHDPNPIAVLDFGEFKKIATRAGILSPELAGNTLLERFWSKVERNREGCWTWKSSTKPGGYGQFHIDGHPFAAHRVVWMLTQGPIPSGAFVLHHCDNPPCVRPDHLYIGNAVDNMRDRLDRGRNPNANKTYCKRGHELTPANVYRRKDGSRRCRTCTLDKQKAIRAQIGQLATPLEVGEEEETLPGVS